MWHNRPPNRRIECPEITVIPNQGERDQKQSKWEPIRAEYLKLSKKYFDTITIQIRTHLGSPMPFISGKTILKLHFRKIYWKTWILSVWLGWWQESFWAFCSVARDDSRWCATIERLYKPLIMGVISHCYFTMAGRKKTRKRRPISQRGGIIARRKRKSRPMEQKGGVIGGLISSLAVPAIDSLISEIAKRR